MHKPGEERRSGQRLRIEEAVSAGGIVFRHGGRGPEVVLCGRTEPRLWGLPKGTPLRGESLEQTAAREVSEETGLQVRIVAPIGTIEYWFARVERGVRFHKRVHHYLMVPTGGDTADHDHEYDVVRWFPVAEAEHLLTYANEAEMLRRAIPLMRDPPRLGDGGQSEAANGGA